MTGQRQLKFHAHDIVDCVRDYMEDAFCIIGMCERESIPLGSAGTRESLKNSLGCFKPDQIVESALKCFGGFYRDEFKRVFADTYDAQVRQACRRCTPGTE